MLRMPASGFGTFIGIEHEAIDDRDEREAVVTKSVYAALAAGVRHFDLAVNYGNIEAVGAAIQKALLPKDKGGLGIKREEIWLTMKTAGVPTAEEMQGYLKQVGVDNFDACLLHFPHSVFSSEKHLRESWSDFCKLKKQNLIRHVGVSNFYRPHLERLISVARKYTLDRPVINEIESNLWCPNTVLVDYCKRNEIEVIAYSPLGYANSAMLLENTTLAKVAKKHQATPAQIALAWQINRGVAVIPKSTKPKRIGENLAASKIKLSEEDLQLLEKIDQLGSLSMTATGAQEHGRKIPWRVMPLSHGVFEKRGAEKGGGSEPPREAEVCKETTSSAQASTLSS